MTTPAQLDLVASLEARDAGIAQVSDSHVAWIEDARDGIRWLRSNGMLPLEVTGEDIRVALLAAGMPAPKRPHAWGALMRTLATGGAIEDTGRSVHMRDVRSHARRTPVWRFAEDQDAP